jgi:WNK lysine deficient protein kinase
VGFTILVKKSSKHGEGLIILYFAPQCQRLPQLVNFPISLCSPMSHSSFSEAQPGFTSAKLHSILKPNNSSASENHNFLGSSGPNQTNGGAISHQKHISFAENVENSAQQQQVHQSHPSLSNITSPANNNDPQLLSNHHYHSPHFNESSSLSSPSPLSLHSDFIFCETSPDGKYSRYDQLLSQDLNKQRNVYLGIDTETGKEIAWTVLSYDETIYTECLSIAQLQHPNILNIYEVWRKEGKLHYVTEKASLTLRTHIHNLYPAKKKILRKYARQILDGLNYLHSKGLIHRDLTPHNIYIDGATGDCRIGNFGLIGVGSPGYIAPDMYSDHYTNSVDIWSLGMVLFTINTDLEPYHTETNGKISQILKLGYSATIPTGMQQIRDESMKKLIELCLVRAELRPTAEELLNSELLKDPIASNNSNLVSSSNNNTQNSQELTISPEKLVNLADTAASKASSADLTGNSVSTPTIHLENSISRQLSAPLLSDSTNPAISSRTAPISLIVSVSSPHNHQESSEINEEIEQKSENLLKLRQKSLKLASEQARAKKLEDKRVKQALMKRRAEKLIHKIEIKRTNNPGIVDVHLFIRVESVEKGEIQEVPASGAEDIANSPIKLNSLGSRAIKFKAEDIKKVTIPAFDFSRDNYAAIAADLLDCVPELSAAAKKIDNLEGELAARMEEEINYEYEQSLVAGRSASAAEIMRLCMSLGIGLNYAHAMIEQEIALEDLLLLNEQDLKEFVPKLGPRRRLQNFIQQEKIKRKMNNGSGGGGGGIVGSGSSSVQNSNNDRSNKDANASPSDNSENYGSPLEESKLPKSNSADSLPSEDALNGHNIQPNSTNQSPLNATIDAAAIYSQQIANNIKNGEQLGVTSDGEEENKNEFKATLVMGHSEGEAVDNADHADHNDNNETEDSQLVTHTDNETSEANQTEHELLANHKNSGVVREKPTIEDDDGINELEQIDSHHSNNSVDKKKFELEIVDEEDLNRLNNEDNKEAENSINSSTNVGYEQELESSDEEQVLQRINTPKVIK